MKDFAILFLFVALAGCSMPGKLTPPSRLWVETGYNVDSVVQPGIPAFDAGNFIYKRDGKSIVTIKLTDPAIAGVAAKPEKWGFFQFPSIYRSTDNRLVAMWNMADDAIESYGQGGHDFSVSKDGGKSWIPSKGQLPTGEGLLLPSGDRIKIYTPRAIKIGGLKLPKPIGLNKNYYKISELPDVLQGIYLNRLAKKATSWTLEHGILEDSMAVRYSQSGLFPLVWWGDMQIAADGSIITGIYPGFYLNEKGEVDPSGVLFYRSTDEGHTWKLQGRIPYQPDMKTDINGDKRLTFGFTEPAFEILSDGTYLCVMRTTDNFVSNTPMYYSRSTDLGVTWTKPHTFTKAGVLPRLLQLNNGVIVLASGRPGVQLRFCTDGQGLMWTDPFEMLPFKNEKDPAVSCGYTGLLATGPNSFLLIYSDFNYRNKDNQIRKAIKVREVTVDRSKRYS